MTQLYFPEQRYSTSAVFDIQIEGATNPNALQSLSLSLGTSEATVGDSVNAVYTAGLLFPGAVTSVTYESSNTGVATVSGAGVVTIVGRGTTTITVTVTAGGSGLTTNSLSAEASLYARLSGRYLTLNFTELNTALDGRYVSVPFVSVAPAGDPELLPLGILSEAYGTATVTGTRSFAPSGWRSSSFGTATIWNYHHFVSPTGSAFGAFGTANVVNHQQFVSPSGIAPPSGQVSSPTQVFDPTQHVTLTSGIAAPSFPTTHYVADYYQYVDLNGFGFTTHAVPAPFIDFRVRTIVPPFIYGTFFGTLTIDRLDVRPAGFEGSSYGTPTVELGTRFLTQHSSTYFGSMGVPHIELYRRYLQPNPIDSLEFGTTVVYNLDQYVEAGPYETNSPPGWWGVPWIYNRNRTLVPNNWTSSRFGRPVETYVENAADPIYPPGLDATLWGAGTFIAHRIRTIPVDGIDSFVSRPWHVVYNAARVIAPSGWTSSAVANPSEVRNQNRTVTQWSVGDTSQFGTAFIAPAIRTLTQFNSYPHLTGYFGTPAVRHAFLYVSPPSIVPTDEFGVPRPEGLFGPTIVWGPFRRTIRPNSAIGPEQFGLLSIINRNRTILAWPVWERDEFGAFTTIENFIRYVAPSGFTSHAVSSLTIRDRTQRLYPGSLTTPAFPTTHQIRNLLPDPPSLQYLFVGAWPNANLNKFGTPSLRFPTIYPVPWTSSSFGTAFVRTSTLTVEIGISNLDQLGVPWVRGPQYRDIQSIGPTSDNAFPKPRLSPYTIYAPLGDQATAQARANHPAYTPPNVIGPEVSGIPYVANRNQRVRPVSWESSVPSSFGTLSISLRRRYIFPVQFRALRMGLPVLSGFQQELRVASTGPSSTFGTATVSRPRPNPWPIAPTGLVSSTLFGSTVVQNFDREILPVGIPHRGNPEQGLTNPWGTAMFGFHRTLTVSGSTNIAWGTHRVEHRIRSLYPEGFESLSLIDDDYGTFRDRMVVRRLNEFVVASIASTSAVGSPTVDHGVRSVTGRGVDMSAVGYHSVRGSSHLSPSGWLSEVFGDIDRWEAEKIKPHGDDMSACGEPRLARPVYGSGVAAGTIGSHRIAYPITVAGMPPIGFDGPSVTDQFGCSRRVITTLPIASPSIPQPVVT